MTNSISSSTTLLKKASPWTRSADGPREPERSERRGALAGAKRPLRTSATLYLTAVTLCVTSCGFKPLHGRAERAEYASQLESVQILSDPGRAPQLLKAEIEDQVNPTNRHAETIFSLTIHVQESEIAVFINPDGTSSRGDMQYRSSYRLTRTLDGKLIDSGNLNRISSYNVSETADYGTYVSREDARKRGILELAQDYKLRLANLLPKLNDPTAKPVVTPPNKAIQLAPIQNSYEQL